MSNNYKRGYETERKAFQELTQQGYHCTRASGSHTTFDLIAVNKAEALFIQCKRVKGKYYSFKKEIERMEAVPIPMNCSKQLWIWLDRMKGRKAGWQKKTIN